MKVEDLKKLEISDEVINDYVNRACPFRLIMSDEWNKKDERDYIERAIERVLKARVPFTSDHNALYKLTDMLIQVINPYTGNVMKMNGGGGNFDFTNINFVDEITGDKVSISLANDAFFIEPSKTKK